MAAIIPLVLCQPDSRTAVIPVSLAYLKEGRFLMSPDTDLQQEGCEAVATIVMGSAKIRN
jgi:uncharacterized metal-binding protein